MFYVQQKSWDEGLALKDKELGKQARGTELLELIRDEHPDFKIDFLFEEGEAAGDALPPAAKDTEAFGPLATSKANASTPRNQGVDPSKLVGFVKTNCIITFECLLS
ncbi:Uncharacterized protein Fot_21965 [Forsythia ovata]|uniref:Uncharacterized protein n=1 Tax=Forsythia ovata TaxID=205694 RepID=A0ABD1UWC7_9LAMI